MVAYKYYESSSESVRIRAFWPVALSLALVSLSFLLGNTALYGAPVDLQSELALKAVTLSDSATLKGIILISIVSVILIVTRSSMSLDYRLKEGLAIIAALIVFGGGGALLNEHWIKNKTSIPRPNIEFLASTQAENVLGMSAEEFYVREHGTQRERLIYTALSKGDFSIAPAVKQHWVSETGYTFPSGHSYIAFFTATFFMFFVCSFVDAKRNVLFYLLLPWAIAVCFSRVALFVHRPVDVMAGAAMGAVVALVAWFSIRFIIRKLVQVEIKA